jgi:hypothetical protein
MPSAEKEKTAHEWLQGKPDDFESTKDWGNFQLAVRNAGKEESWVRGAAGLATTLTAIIGVLTGVITAYQLWQKDAKDEQQATTTYQLEALKLYTEHWKDFDNKTSCPRFLVFATTIKDRAPELSNSVNSDYVRLCRTEGGSGNPDAANNPSADASYNKLEQITANVAAQAPVSASLAGITVFIQYKSNKDEAERIRGLVMATGAKAPGIDAVAAVPRADEIRIYKSSQKQLGDALKAKLDSPERTFTVRSLEASFPKLPANQMEVWLKD